MKSSSLGSQWWFVTIGTKLCMADETFPMRGMSDPQESSHVHQALVQMARKRWMLRGPSRFTKSCGAYEIACNDQCFLLTDLDMKSFRRRNR
jgi:hypothetical protein